ncbi:hypothetical protein DFP72DRAFT_859557 [Ephemerocybe angulata]|uniref:Uncharacterized protein n=1 Tax=Ephemerocybe angulata TaxID=980116 RepID=A0A8H6LWA4_9AGAR|nr:hypothetical protein DFP72DRAFT_859557 [Tulosesus angulatus]
MSSPTDDTNHGFTPTELELRDHDEVSTWAERNPMKPIIPPKKNKTIKLTDAGKITAHARTQQTRENKERLTADIRKFKEEQARALQEIAERHGRTLEYVQGRATAATGFKQTRAPNLHNAKLHFMAKEINEGRRQVKAPRDPASYEGGSGHGRPDSIRGEEAFGRPNQTTGTQH